MTSQTQFKHRHSPRRAVLYRASLITHTMTQNQQPHQKNRRPPPVRNRPVKSRKISQEEETRIEQAKQDFETRRYPSIRTAAKDHDVPYFTLRRRIQGLTQPCKKAHAGQQQCCGARNFDVTPM